MKTLPPKLKTFLLPALIIFLVASLGYGGYSYWQLRQENIRRGEQISELQATVSTTEADLARVKDEKSELEKTLEMAQSRNSELSQTLQTEQNENRAFEVQIGDISRTVGALQKLSEIDPELLQKYSKVYFLSENYAPATLSRVDPQYIYDKNKPQLILAGVAHFLEGMLASASRDGMALKVVSAYRSFAEQAAVKTGHEFVYGSGANQFSADQGYSEHQLGTTVDLTSPEFKGLLLSFEGSAAYKWLVKNAYKFGFIISYPKNNLYYHFEPWHWRFVGVSLATKVFNENKYFYELTQREIDPYLVSIFDQ